MKKIIIIIILLFVLFTGGYMFLKVSNLKESSYLKGYLANDTEKINYYNDKFEKINKSNIRGKQINYYEEEIENNNITFFKLKTDNDNILYVKKDNIVKDYDDIVKEKEKFVKSTTVIYVDKDSIKIKSMAKKGDQLEIIGFDKINDKGIVNKYKIKINDIEGYVYNKYLVNSKDESMKNYNEENQYLIHKERHDKYGGGSADNLDYYPYDKSIKDKKLLTDAETLYLNLDSLKNLDEYIKLAKETEINAFVVDIKEDGVISYPSDVMKDYTKTSYDKAIYSKEEYKGFIKKIKDNGFYVIGRIVAFKDNYFVNDNPNCSITSTKDNKPYYYNGSYWPSVYNRRVWEYNVSLAVNSVKEMNFDEIQFDYMRFPDRTYTIEKKGLINLKNSYNETKAQAVQNFLYYAKDAIHDAGAFISVDVFGETAQNYVTSYGQYLPAISNVVDVVSAMPYPDHFASGQYNLKTPWTEPYKIIKAWSTDFSKRQTEISNPAVARTWLQAYNAIKPPYNSYNYKEFHEEINGLIDGGLTGGYITWNGASSLNKYRSILKEG